MAHILIIDDDKGFRLMLRHMLEKAGYEVSDAPDGKRGIQIYYEKFIDLIITDIFMPEKEGIETITELMKENPDVKIIAVSGGGWKGDFNVLKVARALGVQEIFEKPFDRMEILKAIRELLEKDKNIDMP